MANAKAQTEALVTRDPKSKYFNVVSTVSIEELTPETLGALMAMYEHKTTMLGTLFGINAFDQPGVEEGKNATYAMFGRPGYEEKKKELDERPAKKDKYIIR